jgi:DNA invertase Pin-like site-specific DNA recombinase/PHD/YefM family antitoxin component YafN of YafNO toxin-antitoxin module
MSKPRRAIGIIRVSQVKGREGESFVSPSEQRERIEAACERDGLRLTRTADELDVSGKTSLEDRKGLREAIEAVEAGDADVIVAAYFDRLVRSLKVQAELVQRVERAGGKVLAVDVGQVTEGTASEWLNGTMHGMVSEYYARLAGERTAAAQRRAVARGVAPFPNVPPGYVRNEDGTLSPHPTEAPIVAEAFRMRAEGTPIKDVRAYLKANGIERTFRGVQTLLASRIVLGEISFVGDKLALTNKNAHRAIVDDETWQRVQRQKVTRGRKAKSDRLLARLGVLRCATCERPMAIGNSNTKYPTYRCSPMSDCPQRMAITADIAERVVSEQVRAALADTQGHASAETNIRQAEQALQTAQGALDAALRAFDGFDESVARRRLLELREARDAAQADLDQLGGTRPALTINGAEDWDRLTLAERRALIRAIVARAVVRPGRGADRVVVELVGSTPHHR